MGDSLLNIWAKLLKSLEDVPYPIFLKDAAFRWIYGNRSVRDLYGFDEYSYIGKKDEDLMYPEEASYCKESDLKTVNSKKNTESIELQRGKYFDVHKTPLLEDDKLIGFLGMAPEITELVKANKEALIQMDFYKALLNINQLITKRLEPHELFQEICNTIGTYTGVPLIWIGTINKKASKFDIITQYKKSEDIPDINNYFISTDPNSPFGKGAAARCARTSEKQTVRDVFTDTGLSPWWPVYKKNNITSLISLPILKNSELFAVLTVYAKDKNFLTDNVVRLLEETAADIGFSLEDYERGKQLRLMALHDSLTGLPNRMLFNDRFNQAIKKAKRDDKHIAIGILNLDEFKYINSKYGHKAGDELLKTVAMRLLNAVRQTDTVARLTGDEFGLIFQDFTGLPDLNTFLRRLSQIISENVKYKNQTIYISFSLGIALYPEDGLTQETILRRSELALYHAKRDGKGYIRFFTSALENEVLRLHKIQGDFINALESKRILLYYQPQVELPSGKIVGFEALSRLKDKNGLIRTPSEFISIIESDPKLITKLGEYVLSQTAKDIPKFKKLGLNLPISVNVGARHLLHTPIAVNIGAKHLLSTDFLVNLKKFLKQHKHIAQWLKIEITEAAYLSDINKAKEVLNGIHSLKLSISLDDYGTSYASLTHLQNLPVDQIKLDVIFTRNMLTNNKNLAIILGVITTANMLGLDLIAEGVETEEDAIILESMGCKKAQGYAIAHPMPFGELKNFLKTWKPPKQWLYWKNKRWKPELYNIFAMGLCYSRQIKNLLGTLKENGENKKPSLSLEVIENDSAKSKYCDLSRWINSRDMKRFHKDKLFLEIKSLHNDIHLLVKELHQKSKPFTYKEKRKLLSMNLKLITVLWKFSSKSSRHSIILRNKKK